MSGAGSVFGAKQRGIRAAALVAAGLWMLLCLLYVSARIENEQRIALGELKASMQRCPCKKSPNVKQCYTQETLSIIAYFWHYLAQQAVQTHGKSQVQKAI